MRFPDRADRESTPCGAMTAELGWTATYSTLHYTSNIVGPLFVSRLAERACGKKFDRRGPQWKGALQPCV